jgi:hypothetical protein
MTVVSETRVLPETLDITWEKLREAFARQTPDRTGEHAGSV